MKMTSKKLVSIICTLGIVCVALQGCVHQRSEPVPSTDMAKIGELFPGFPKGYLAHDALPDSLAILPPPPATDSAAGKADEAAYIATRALADGPRGEVATRDADLRFPRSLNAFACATGFEVDPNRSPQLATLLQRSFSDAAVATSRAKNHYQRTRPFVAHDAHTCFPQDEAMLKKDGSYPSGHSAIGWVWALILSELVPDRTTAIQERGFAFARSRVICGAHWASDTVQGMLVGSATYARLQADPTFLAQLQAAKAEVGELRGQPQPVTRDCAAEAEALRLDDRAAP